MATKNNRAYYTITLVVSFALILWYISYPASTLKHEANPLLVYASQIFAVVGFSLFSLSFVFATRFKLLENFFGGLDKVYHLHHSIGKTAFFVLLIHPVLLALRWLPEDFEKLFTYLLPLHRKLEINFGSWSLLGLIVLILLSLVIKIPYDKWKITHKFMGLFYILGVLHVFTLENFITQNWALSIYFILLSVLGVVSYLYKTFLYRLLSRRLEYKVVEVQWPTSQVLRIFLEPGTEILKFLPGQFCFFRFGGKNISNESHPFTICSTPGQHLEIIVKDLGDYTHNLYKSLKPGNTALLEGPYGHFNFDQGMEKQVWIAGGVGVAPFISWLRKFDAEGFGEYEIDFHYCFHNRADAIYLEWFEEIQLKYEKFSFNPVCSEETGHLKAKNISNIHEKSIFICGPKKLRRVLLKDLKILRVPQQNIFFEDFDFV